MQTQFSLTGKDSIQVAGRNITALGDGDVFTGSYPNKLVTVKTGKDGNAIYATNATGQMLDATLRVIRASADDQYLNALLALMNADLSAFPLISAYLVKRVGDGSGNVKRDTYQLAGGVFTQNVNVSSNVEGNTDQSLSIYNFTFSSTIRQLL